VPVKVHATRMLVRHVGVEPDFEIEAKNVGDMIDTIDRSHDGFRDSICDETGSIRAYVNVFVNGENLQRERSPLSFGLKDGDEVYILANVAGGSRRAWNSS
jgi:sulfur-carrier protein